MEGWRGKDGGCGVNEFMRWFVRWWIGFFKETAFFGFGHLGTDCGLDVGEEFIVA